ncbi:hypothetical protein AB0H60_34095 [Nocardia rhamnosiphila]|uniref:hypothetical protein n=1 Tax=Nocardia rhamnosiphila TaxID=426716 RepID=UPI0033F5CB01
MADSPEPPKVSLPPRRSRRASSKRPFSTQLRSSTLGRLDWLVSQGYVLTDTVDAAINAYLDAAGVPPADEFGQIQQQKGDR